MLVVTGGSRGIGAAVARLGARSGYRVAVVYLESARPAQSVVSEVEGAGGIAKAFKADVSNPNQVSQLFDSIANEVGTPTGLVTSAGRTGGASALLDVGPDQLQQVIGVNLLGTFYCLREAALRMAKSRGGGGGGIVTISSEAARFGGNRLAAYAAAKAGISTLTIAAARELAEEGIRVNAVSPGVIDTDQHAGQSGERIAGLLNSIPLKRMGLAEEVAEAVIWLLSDKSSYVTGSVLSVNGGR